MWNIHEIPCNSFYGTHTQNLEIEKSIKPVLPLYHSRELRKLQGPCITWKTFKKQDECLKFVSNRSDLMPFTFQDIDNSREFLAANPLIYWYYYAQRNVKDKHAYEIIQEYKPCKLYFDLEFERVHNQQHDGIHMVECFIKLVCHALQIQYNITCNRSDVLDLDSTSNTKFSRHLIFQLDNAIFRDNYNAGLFVKQLCYEVKCIIKANNNSLPNLILLQHFNIPIDDIKQLEVVNSKGVKVLFCDEAVYSKNRHFRLYGSSKLNKNITLIVSEQNKFFPIGKLSYNFEEQIFISSLITYVSKLHNSRYLMFQSNKINKIIAVFDKKACISAEPSPFTDVDNFISTIVYPGQIWRTAYFPATGVVTYDIINNRFCRNIGREHKSNNIKYIVNIPELIYYQKCYDPDCANYKSPMEKLPINLNFLLNDKMFTNEDENNIDEGILDELDDSLIYTELFNEETLDSHDFPDYGLHDTQLVNI